MKEFDDLWGTTETLFGPNGCPWDKVQTLQSSRPFVVEESAEVIEAIDLGDSDHLREELGDFLFVALFLCKLADKEKHCTLQSVLKEINEKIIRRHPHVFGDVDTIKTSEQVLDQWNEIKKKEKGKTHRKSILDSVAKGLPALTRAQKVYGKLKKAGYEELPPEKINTSFEDEDSLGNALLSMVAAATAKGLDAEHALRKTLVTLEGAFRNYEQSKA
jgi:tetrapyrrole methylase family protein / MazG family protein